MYNYRLPYLMPNPVTYWGGYPVFNLLNDSGTLIIELSPEQQIKVNEVKAVEGNIFTKLKLFLPIIIIIVCIWLGKKLIPK